MFDLIKSIQARDAAKPTFMEVVLGYNGFHAVILHRASHWLWHIGLKALARFVANIARAITGVDIHPEALIGKRLFIDHGTGLVIGQTAIVGDDVTLYHGVTLGGVGQGAKTNGRRHPYIMDGVMVGASAQILGGITVGKGAKVGSSSVVLRDVPDGATVVGNPARIVNCPKDGRQDYAYGITRELIDPLTETIDGLVRDIEELKKKSGTVKKPSVKDGPDYAELWKGSGI